MSVTPNQATPAQLLAADCPSGDHAPVLVDLGASRIRYTLGERDGSPSHEYTLGLDPPHLERETSRGGGGELTWDYDSFGGQDCQEDLKGRDCSPVMVEASIEDEVFAKGGWKTTGLGECAMLVDGGRTDGNTSHGEWIAHGSTSSVRMLLSGGTLYVEVTDDAFVTKGAAVDSLVFYSTSPQAMPGYRSGTARLRMDGQLTDWNGTTRPVDVAIGASTRRFALTDVWPGREGLWRLAYEDTDDGRTFGPGQWSGNMSHEPWVFVSPMACVARDGELHVDRKTVTDAHTPIAP